MSRYYEITDGNLHVGWASEDYMFDKMDERVLMGEANFNFHVGDDAVDVVPVRHGHWILSPVGWKCSNCGDVMIALYAEKDGRYCPHCGAKMDGGKDDE